jgi:hypothetical protein
MNFKSEDELRKALSEYALRAGQRLDQVQRALQSDSEGMTVGQRARGHLDALMADPGFRAKLESGDMEALNLFNAYTIGISWQNEQDSQVELAASREGVEKFNAELAAAEATKAQAAADASTSQP